MLHAVSRGVLILVLACGLGACVPERSVRVDPVERGRSGHVPQRPPEYLVARGDTLYGIAFRHGLDYRELAALNRIAAPYTIYPGQRLRLADKPPPAPSRPPRRTTGVAARPEPAKPQGVVAPIVREQTPVPATPNAGRPDGKPSSGQGVVAGTANPAPAKPAPTTVVTATTGPVRWQWPADGRVIGTFLDGDPTRQGINLAGNAGDEVRAAADGVVVYSGSGLIGYGELIIVKHDETWLSAYGHNRKRLVEEGAQVKSGQRIAEMGRSGASRDMLHFEVRKSGRSVNPLGVLPRR